MVSALREPGLNMDKLSYEIFSILESKFLFGDDSPKPSFTASTPATPAQGTTLTGSNPGRVRILSIDGSNDLLAPSVLARLESLLQKQSGDSSARVADFFDIAAGSGSGGVLAAMLFTKGPHGQPLFTADEALKYLSSNGGKLFSPKKKGIYRLSGGGKLGQVFADATLKDTLKPLLIPCFDLSTAAPFLFSRSDAVEMNEFDFRIRDVCSATCARGSARELKSVDGNTRIKVLGGTLAMQNPTATAITHVLNNKHEFPFTSSVEDRLVVSLGGGAAAPSKIEPLRIAGVGEADMVDQAVAMAFGENRTRKYVRIQGNGFGSMSVEEVLMERNVDSVMFRGKRVLEECNAQKLELFSSELVKEEKRRSGSSMPTVMIKQAITPRTSSATTSQMMSNTTSSSRASGSP